LKRGGQTGRTDGENRDSWALRRGDEWSGESIGLGGPWKVLKVMVERRMMK
jgi:hypothetical protein